MQMSEYLIQSGRTAAEGIDLSQWTHEEVVRELIDMDRCGVLADVMKRNFFYSAPMKERLETNMARLKEHFEDVEKHGASLDHIHPDLLHAALGIYSEAGEILSAIIVSALSGKPVDYVNLKEELGDLMWYMALLMRLLETTFEAIGKQNIEKLQKRFPDKFTKDKAVNRDLDGERKILEANG